MTRPVGRIHLPLDVEFMEDDRIAEVGERAGWMYLAMCLRSKGLLSDGHLTERQVSRLPVTAQGPRLAALARVGLIVKTGTGWHVTAFGKHNKTAAAITEKLERRAAASAAANHKRWHVERDITDPTCDLCRTPNGLRTDSESESPETETETETETVTTDLRPPSSPRKRGTPTPDLFPITPDLLAWGRENAPLVLNPRAETARFLDYHRAKGSLFKDWPAAWRTWMRNAQKFALADTPQVSTGNPATAWAREQG
jgi:hypothetical protein